MFKSVLCSVCAAGYAAVVASVPAAANVVTFTDIASTTLERTRKCPVIVAKLDRVSRDVAFIAGLMAQRVPFIVAELGAIIGNDTLPYQWQPSRYCDERLLNAAHETQAGIAWYVSFWHTRSRLRPTAENVVLKHAGPSEG